MTKLTTESLEKFVNDIKTDGMCDITDYQVALALRQLLAYEQADKTTDLKTLVISEIVDFYSGFESPCEPETVDEAQRQLIGRIEKVFGLAAPAQPVIPEQAEPTISFYRDGIIAAAKWVENQRDAYDNEHGQSDPDTGAFEFGNDAQLEYSTTLSEIAEGIRSLHPASAQPVSEPYKFPQGWIKGQFAYQDLFNAIGAAVVSKYPSIEISVKAFEDSMLAATPAQESE